MSLVHRVSSKTAEYTAQDPISKTVIQNAKKPYRADIKFTAVLFA